MFNPNTNVGVNRLGVKHPGWKRLGSETTAAPPESLNYLTELNNRIILP